MDSLWKKGVILHLFWWHSLAFCPSSSGMDINFFGLGASDCYACNFYIVRICIFTQNLRAQPKIYGPQATGPLLKSIPVVVLDITLCLYWGKGSHTDAAYWRVGRTNVGPLWLGAVYEVSSQRTKSAWGLSSCLVHLYLPWEVITNVDSQVFGAVNCPKDMSM